MAKPSLRIGQAAPSISEKKATSLLKAARTHKESTGELNTQYAALVRDAVDNHYLDKKVFGIIRALDRIQDDATLRIRRDNLLLYLDIFGITKRADDAPDLPMEDEEGATNGRRRSAEVKPFPQPEGAQRD